MSKDTGGPAFPSAGINHLGGQVSNTGMTLRDYFASHATDKEVDELIPPTCGEASALMVQIGIITKKDGPAYRSYLQGDIIKLRCWARYQIADAMLAERNKGDHANRSCV